MNSFYQHTSISLLILILIGSFPITVPAEVNRLKYQADGNYLIVEVLDDDLFHFEYGTGVGPSTDQPIATTEMICNQADKVPAVVCKTNFNGPTQFNDNGEGILETPAIRLQIDLTNLFITPVDKTKNNLPLTTISPLNLHQDWKGLRFTRTQELDVYGLGQQFVEPGNSDIDWDGRIREGNEFGNVMAGFNGGANGNTQIPILYAVNGATYENYALFLDNKYRQRWDFTNQSQWKVEMFGEPIRFYVMTGADLLDLRTDYMNLVGHPLVPPKKMFGLWVSEFGYDNWSELEDKLNTLRAQNFPLDGFVLDLQWFGGIPAVTGKCGMGSLDFDETTFPAPQEKIQALKDEQGIGIMLIEEAYICKNLSEYQQLQEQGCLVMKVHPDCSQPVAFENWWWGSGGMLDYTNDNCSLFWHDTERKKLIDQGVIGHWTDLGEPEMFDSSGCYSVGTQADAHNIFNFRWLRGIYHGYGRNEVQQRPFVMSRSGTAGIQRFGTAMWSGDIGSRLENLAAHAANQMHMSFSGIDYYGSDIGGFHRGDMQHNPDKQREMYTQWHAFGMMFDIPGRPHTKNLCNCKETAPDRIGDRQSNLANTQQRYELIPYLYSLAHRAYLYGEPVIPPLVMYYQTDNNVRHIGQEKMIGRDLLVAIAAQHGETNRDVYLPAGTWYDWHTHQKINSVGISLPKVPEYRNGIFKLPLYARAGAIIPLAFVDENTLNAVGKRKDDNIHNELIVKVFALDGSGESTFTLYEDDGETIAYQNGAVRQTQISQTQVKNDDDKMVVTVEIHPAEGDYANASSTRNNVIKLIGNQAPETVTLNGNLLQQFMSLSEFNQAQSGWTDAGNQEIIAKSGDIEVSVSKQFVVTLDPDTCKSEYNAISIPGKGNGWNPADPQRTLTCVKEKIWKGQVTLVAEEYKFAANGSWQVNWGCDGKQDGPNCPPRPSGTYNVTFNEADPAHPQFECVKRIDSDCVEEDISAQFICENGYTNWGTSVYVVGNIPEMGQWKTEKAVKLDPNGPYPTWTGVVDKLPPNTHIEWKCIKRLEGGDQRVIQWQPGANNAFTTPANGTVPDQIGRF